jgi:uncharacterized protein (DUF3084 family)
VRSHNSFINIACRQTELQGVNEQRRQLGDKVDELQTNKEQLTTTVAELRRDNRRLADRGDRLEALLAESQAMIMVLKQQFTERTDTGGTGDKRVP